jgi:TIGR03009 family protein
MRRVALILTAALVAFGPAAAQTPPAPPSPPATAPTPADQLLDRHLQRWEQEMARVQTLIAEVRLTEMDPVFKSVTKTVGYARYMKTGTSPNTVNLASLELHTPDNRGNVDPKMPLETLSQKIVLTGAFMYVYVPGKKEIQAHAIKKPLGGQVADDNIFTMMFGMRAGEARRRYEMKLANEDEYYLYIMVTPRNAQDRAEFTRARIVLNKQTYLPAQLWFENGTEGKRETTWEIPAIKSGVRLDRQDFDAPKPPKEWRMVQVQADDKAPPRGFRPDSR